jgi:hypothetical protein
MPPRSITRPSRATVLCAVLAAYFFFTSTWVNSNNEMNFRGSETKMGLLVNCWAPSLKVSPHREEVVAAISANIANTHIAEVYVILQTTETYGCSDLERDVFSLGLRLPSKPRKKLVCRSHDEQLISYYEMFQVADEITKSRALSVMIVANADMVFDDSVRHLKRLAPDVLATIATQGLSSEQHEWSSKTYEILTQNTSRQIVNRCYDLAVQNRTSWDAFAFNPRVGRLAVENFVDKNTRKPFPMNQNGAEAAALNGLWKTSRFRCAIQMCDHIKMWHFHTQPKTHNGDERFVELAYSWPSDCGGIDSCVNPKSCRAPLVCEALASCRHR